ncbi:MAG: methyltransferase domain-containing protein [Nanoarchaeota archaeon]|nr:methyltransferase domain-containing protein [Nanoarchaeota archaeon]
MIISLLQDLENQSNFRKIPILGREKGTWLHAKVEEIQPERVLELGTANGYSGIILGNEGAELMTIEINPAMAQEAKNNFAQFSVNANIIIGDAVEEVQTLVQDTKNIESFDIIFIDFAKAKYIEVLDNCLKLVKKGGFIIADNIQMEGCQNYKMAVLKHPQLKTELIKIKDGLSCSERIK